jgi:mannose-6-phosphate isomerase-like protein (cupin superfamily)
LSIYLRGKALAGAGSDRLTIEPGYVRVMPAGVPHFFHNISADEPAELIGIYPNASSVENTGYVYHGVPTDADFAECAAQEAAGRRFPVARVDAAAAYEAAGKLGWSGTDYRELLSAPTGNGAFAFMAKLAVGGGRQPHRLANADSFYFIQSGQATGSANGSAFASQARDAWYTPRGEVLQFENASPHEPLVMYGFHIGAQTSLDLGCLVSDGP